MSLDRLKNADFTDQKLKVKLAGEVRGFQCLSRCGAGEKSVVWKAIDHLETPYAIKFVTRDEYGRHSLQAELKYLKQLGPRFAQIHAYGNPVFSRKKFEFVRLEAYAIVCEWIDGQTFEDFCIHYKTLNVNGFFRLANELCEALAFLEKTGLRHSDLHAKNVMVVEEKVGPTLSSELHLKVIDTGSLMTQERHKVLMEKWANDAAILEGNPSGSAAALKREHLLGLLNWFRREDQEWVVFHLVSLVNILRANESTLPNLERKFIKEITPILLQMVDQDRSRRLAQAQEMFQEMEMLWKRIVTPAHTGLMTPFDFISAELIRSDTQLNELFSDKCPWFEKCASTDPIYIYGPRGCGKSTILRKLSLPGVLTSKDAKKIFDRCPYIGVYISCTSELRSRFLLFPKELYPKIQADVLLFFTILLVDALLDTFEILSDGRVEPVLGHSVGLTSSTAQNIFEIVAKRLEIADSGPKLNGLSWLTYARKELAIKRSQIWRKILTDPQERPADPSLLFEICKDMESVFPLLKQKHIAFLIDDYSNQRIPVEIQRMLNQTISFAKQGNPIFKVSSEYQGVDLEGIQEGREVVEVNLGQEYVDLTDKRRSFFLEDVLNIRFAQAGLGIKIESLLGRSNVKPAVPMARAIRDSDNEKFYYHGIDTIADVCSGDLAMALDLVKHIYVQVKQEPRLPSPVSAKIQHDVIHNYSDREHMYLRYFAEHGKEISLIMDALCWLARESAMRCISTKEGKAEPMVKTHLDISLQAVQNLCAEYQKVLQEMQKKGVLFSLDTSRSRIASRGTERYQIRRILLAKYVAPLGRRDPIKLDTEHKLLHLLQNPKQFAEEEVSGQSRMKL